MEERDIIFKVGTKVKLRDYLKVGSYYGGVKFEEFCKKDFGKVLTITKVTPYISTTKYEFEETPLEYTIEMLEPIKKKTMKYEVGDKVRIKKNLKADKWYGIEIVVNEMLKCAGRSATITKVVECDKGIKYSIDISGWNWTEEMFESTVDCGFKVGDKVIMNPEKSKRLGVLTITSIYKSSPTALFYMLSDNNGKPAGGWLAESIIKVPLFKVGQIVTFKNIDNDRWPHNAYIEGESGIIASIDMHFYAPSKPGEDGNRYHVRSFKTGTCWHTTSASLELVPLIATLDDTKVTAADDPGLRGYLGVVVRDNSALAIAQAVDNVKGPQFKIGDRVLIREDLVPGKKYEEWDYSPEDGMGGWEFAAAMTKYMGKVATITGYVGNDPNYCHLDIDKGTYSWIVNALLHYTPGSDYDLDRTVITNKQQTKQNYENRLQEKGPVIAGRERQSGCAVRYPGEQIRVGISNLGYRKVTCKR